MTMKKISSLLLSATMVAGTFTGAVSAEEKTYATTGEAFEVHYIARTNETGAQSMAMNEIVAMYQEQGESKLYHEG